MVRTIQSPGVEIKEYDLSENPSPAIGTYTFITGFADKGPTDEVLQVTSAEEFEQIYGLPTTPAERYFYHSVTQQFNSQANVLVARLPYGVENGDGFSEEKIYSILAYPVESLKMEVTPLTTTVTAGTTAFMLPANAVNVTLSAKNVEIDGEQRDVYSYYTSKIASPSATYDEANQFIIKQPKHIKMTEEEYTKFADGSLFDWSKKSGDINSEELSSLGNAGLIIVNKSQTTINDQYEGYYIGIADNVAVEPDSKYQSILGVNSVNGNSEYVSLPNTRMNFVLSADANANGSSISQVMEDSPSFDIFGSEFDDTLIVNVFKLRKSLYADSTIKLDANLSESYTASVDFYRQMQSQSGGAPVSFFLEKKAENSTDIQILVNPYLSGKKTGKQIWLDKEGKTCKKIRVAFSENNTEFSNDPDIVKEDKTFDKKYALSYGMTYKQATMYADDAADELYALGLYQANGPANKTLGSIPQKLSRILSKIDNRDMFELDITVDAGLSTIWSYYKLAQLDVTDEQIENSEIPTISGETKDSDEYKSRVRQMLADFDDEYSKVYEYAEKGNWFKTGQDGFDANGGADGDMLVNWRTIYNLFSNFASNDRKDHVHIADPLRFIFLQGANTKTLSNKSRNFSQHIFWPLKYLFMTANTANTSYAATYGNWGKVYDSASDSNIWIPMSGVLASVYANTDNNYFCWYAPAGPDRGILTTITDIAFSPAMKQRDQLYKISVNPIYQDPNMGFVVFGQKTLQSKPSAFDRINVRRLFLYLEKSTYNTIKWFVFRNNTYSTRMAVVNTLDPIFRSCKNNEGLYNYLIKCDSTNNSNEVIDANELKVDIFLQPTRTAEFICVDFYATKTGTNFEELFK